MAIDVGLGVVLQTITAGLVAIIVWYFKKLSDAWNRRGDRGEKLERLVIGDDIDGGHGEEGLLSVVEEHERRIDTVETRLDEAQERVDALCRKNECLREEQGAE